MAKRDNFERRNLASQYVVDLDLSPGKEHLTVVGNGGKRRTILLDDPGLGQQLRAYL